MRAAHSAIVVCAVRRLLSWPQCGSRSFLAGAFFLLERIPYRGGYQNRVIHRNLVGDATRGDVDASVEPLLFQQVDRRSLAARVRENSNVCHHFTFWGWRAARANSTLQSASWRKVSSHFGHLLIATALQPTHMYSFVCSSKFADA